MPRGRAPGSAVTWCCAANAVMMLCGVSCRLGLAGRHTQAWPHTCLPGVAVAAVLAARHAPRGTASSSGAHMHGLLCGRPVQGPEPSQQHVQRLRACTIVPNAVFTFLFFTSGLLVIRVVGAPGLTVGCTGYELQFCPRWTTLSQAGLTPHGKCTSTQLWKRQWW